MGFKVVKRIFISYAHDKHSALAEKLREDLEKNQYEVWLDIDRLKPGEDWEEYIEEGLNWVSEYPDQGRIMLIMTPHAIRRPKGFCLNELTCALNKGLAVVPIMLVLVEPPLSICRIQWLDMQDCVPINEREKQYETRFEKIIDALEHDKLDFMGNQSRLLRLLSPLSFDADISQNLEHFAGREWIFKKIEKWMADPDAQRIFWITGKPGMGKTAIAAYLCSESREVAAFHLCSHGHRQKADPRKAVLSIAYQLSTQLYEYQERLNSLDLESIVPESDAGALFDDLIVQPLSKNFPRPDRTIIILIDGLDEASEGGRNELARFIATEFAKTPDWLRLIITSRPDPAVKQPLQGFDSHVLDNSIKENEKDIRCYLRKRLPSYFDSGVVPESVINTIIARSEGIFLYVKLVCEEIIRGRLSANCPDEFPQGLGGIYAEFFQRQFPCIGKFENDIRPALEIISAAQAPIEINTISAILNWNCYNENEFLYSTSSLFLASNNRIQPFHRSVIDWLTDKNQSVNYFVSKDEGHKKLANFGWSKYRENSKKMSRYMLTHLPAHLAQADCWDELRSILTNKSYSRSKYLTAGIYNLVATMHMSGQMKAVSAELVKMIQRGRSDSFRQKIRSAFSQFFGHYSEWPNSLRGLLEKSKNIKIMLFLGETHDMETQYDAAELIFIKMKARAKKLGYNQSYSTACLRMAAVWEHRGRPKKALKILNNLISEPDAKKKFKSNYWWAKYQMAINLRLCGEYNEAKDVLLKLKKIKYVGGLLISVLHQLGVIYLEMEQFDKAEKKFSRCMRRRRKQGFRKAYEHRRLGQVYGITERFEKARDAFSKSTDISTQSGNWRYVGKTRSDTLNFLILPYLRKKNAAVFSLPDISEHLGTDRALLLQGFRQFKEKGKSYLEIIDKEFNRPTGQVARQDVIHRDGMWHTSVIVLILDDERNIIMQQNSESDSYIWEVSVRGHQDIGESDILAAVRCVNEKLGLTIDPDSLIRLGKPYQFNIDDEADKNNRERMSAFILKISGEQKQKIASVGEDKAQTMKWLSFANAITNARSNPEQFRSSFKQLLNEKFIQIIEQTIS